MIVVLVITFVDGSKVTVSDLVSVEVYEGENVTVYDETNIQSFRIKASADYVFVGEKTRVAATSAAIAYVALPNI